MPKGPGGVKRPRDPVQLGKLIGDILTGQVEDKAPLKGEMEELGRVGGPAAAPRIVALSPEKRKEIAKAAAAKKRAKKAR